MINHNVVSIFEKGNFFFADGIWKTLVLVYLYKFK